MNFSSFVNLRPEALSYLYTNSSHFQERSLDGQGLSKSKRTQKIVEQRIAMFNKDYCHYFTQTFPIDTSRVRPNNLKTKVDDYLRNYPEKANLDERFRNVLRFSTEIEHVAFWIEAGIRPSTTSLNLALKNNSSFETTTLLLSHGAKPNTKSLSYASIGEDSLRNTKLLIASGVNPDKDTISYFLREKIYPTVSEEHYSNDVQIFELLFRKPFQVEEGLLDLAIVNNHPPRAIQRLLKECIISETTIQLLITNFYPFETVAFAMKQTEAYEVTEIDEDLPDATAVKVPIFDQETLVKFARLAHEHGLTKDNMKIFVSEDLIAEITGTPNSSI